MVFHIGDKTYKSEGDTVTEALRNIKPKERPMGFGLVELTIEGTRSDIPLRINKYKLERIFGNNTELEIFAKRLETLA